MAGGWVDVLVRWRGCGNVWLANVQAFDLRKRGAWHTASVLTGAQCDCWQAFDLRERGAQHCIAAGGCGAVACWCALYRIVRSCLTCTLQFLDNYLQ